MTAAWPADFGADSFMVLAPSNVNSHPASLPRASHPLCVPLPLCRRGCLMSMTSCLWAHCQWRWIPWSRRCEGRAYGSRGSWEQGLAGSWDGG